MKFYEFYSGRYVMLILGLLWSLLLPGLFVWIFLSVGAETGAIVAYVFIVILWLIAVRIFFAGIYGFKRNKKAVILIVREDGMEALLYGKRNAAMQSVSFAEICDFSFSSNGTIFNKFTQQYEINPNSTGVICFASKKDKNECFRLSIYDADVAAKMILEKIDESQIDRSDNELSKDGVYTPKG